MALITKAMAAGIIARGRPVGSILKRALAPRLLLAGAVEIAASRSGPITHGC